MAGVAVKLTESKMEPTWTDNIPSNIGDVR
jgi:hypothetical protein